MSIRSLKDGGASFDATVLEATAPSRIVLFAVGGGGDPGRHHPLLETFAGLGCTVIAPHFERLVASTPAEPELCLRARRLRLALRACGRSKLPVAGVGHSIGATTLLALAGARVWTRVGHSFSVEREKRLDRLALLATPTSFFQGPNALDTLPESMPVLAWAGTEDTLTPPEQTLFLERALETRVPLEVHITPGAGHFSFMHEPPPNATEPLADRDAFLAELTCEIARFVMAEPEPEG